MHPFRTLAKEKATGEIRNTAGGAGHGRCTLTSKRARRLPYFLGCRAGAFEYFGGVPEEILYDRVRTVWLREDERGDPVFHPGFLEFANYYGV